jgi:YidC/Oxa1 family membrane protein insertase
VSAVLRDYRTLAADGTKSDKRVELVRPGEKLLSYRLVVPGDTIALDRVPFALTDGAADAPPNRLTYEAALENARVAITYAFAPDSYTVRVSGRVEGVGSRGYLLVDLPSGIRSEEADTLDDQRNLAYALKPVRENAKSIPFDKLDPGETRLEPGPLTWVVAKNKYFLVGLLTPEGDQPFAELKVTGGPRTSKQASQASATAVEPLRDGTFAFEMYAGPQEWRRLVAQGRDFENANPYGGFLQGLVQPFATLVMKVLLWMHETLRLNYGWVLIIFGVVVRLALWPLNQRAMRTSMRMQTLQPQLQAVQERYKGDPQKVQAEIMRVYKENGMSPFSAVSGCLPMLIPMPVFITLFFVFQNTIEFRGVPFLWLNDISLKDPYYILPLLMGASAYALSWIGLRSAPANPQAKMMSYIFPVMMLIFFVNAAAGLNLYYAVQNLAALPQQWLIANERAKAPPVVATAKTEVRGKDEIPGKDEIRGKGDGRGTRGGARGVRGVRGKG